MSDLIDRQAVIDQINERQRKLIYCFGLENDVVKIMDIAKSIVIAIPSAEPEKVLVAEVKLSKDQIQDAVDKAVEKMKEELEPCGFCKHKDDCGDMALYCPSERREYE